MPPSSCTCTLYRRTSGTALLYTTLILLIFRKISSSVIVCYIGLSGNVECACAELLEFQSCWSSLNSGGVYTGA